MGTAGARFQNRWTNHRSIRAHAVLATEQARALSSPTIALPSRQARPSGSPRAERGRLWTEWLATAVLLSALLTALIVTGATSRLDNILYDMAVKLRRQAPRPDIVIVAIDQASLRRIGQWPWSRGVEAQLITDIARAKPKALTCHFFFLAPTNPADDQALRDAIKLTRTYLSIPLQTLSGVHQTQILKPIPILAAAAAGVGTGDARPDEDGIVRRTQLFGGPPDHPLPSLAVQMAQLDEQGRRSIGSPSRDVERLIPFVGGPGSFATVSAIAVLDGKVPPATFQNRYVMLGSTAPELLDNYATPMSAADGMPSVEVEANVLNSLLTGSTITPASCVTDLFFSFALLWVVLIGLVRLGPQDNLWLAAIMSGAPLAASIVFVVTPGLWIAPTPYLITIAILFPYWGWRRLHAASAYFADELRALEVHGDGVVRAAARPPGGLGGDVVLRQMLLLDDTKRRISDLRRFVADMLADFPDPVLVVNLQGRVQTVNPAARAFARRAGLSAEPDTDVEPILATVSPFGGDIRALWPPPDPSCGPRAPLTGEDPQGRAYDVRFTPTRGGDDTFTGWIVHLADITPLVSAMRQREEALQLLSHDMRSPLSSILASLSHPDFQGAPAALRRRIEGQAVRGLDLADAFVRLAKAETADYQLEAIDFAHVLHDSADAVWSQAQAAGVKIEFEPDDTEYVVLADRGLMTRAIVNLLENAVKFSRAGQRVTCALKPGVLNGASAVICEIADRAGGMTRAQLTVLFRRFASGRDSEGGSPGVGLGLALVNAVITRHQGTIACDSTEGEGTVFAITLPRLETVESPVASED